VDAFSVEHRIGADLAQGERLPSTLIDTTDRATRGKSGCLPNSVIRLRATVSALHGAWRALHAAPTMGCRSVGSRTSGRSRL